MGWKNLKEALNIGHIVHVRGGWVCIGSTYCPELIKIDPKTGKREIDHRRENWVNEDLTRYAKEVDADPEKIARLLREPDTFEKSLQVFTWKGGNIVEQMCEAYGFPNVTHDGELMYDNSHSPSRSEIVKAAIRNAESRIESLNDRIQELEDLLADAQARRIRAGEDLKKLKEEK